MDKKSVTLNAPAKINLTLEVLGKRPDGYHDIRSVIQTIDLRDELQFESDSVTSCSSDMPGWAGKKSLIAEAAALLQEKTGRVRGTRISVKKRIPLSSGLGGDSSDAAAVLKGLNELWGLKLKQAELLELAATLGSDVPFFLYGGTSLMEGRGDKITPLPGLPESWFVLIVPDMPRPEHKTQALYSALKKEHYSDGGITERLVKVVQDGKKLKPEYLFNSFENIVFSPQTSTLDHQPYSVYLNVYREHIYKIGADNVHLAGSGPTMFTFVRDRAEGEDIAARIKGQGMGIWVVSSKNK